MMKTTGINALENAKIVIVGGSSGIGFAVAKAAVALGAEVIIASGNINRINEAVAAIGDNIKGFAVNVTSEKEVQSFFEKIGSFDHLVYTAGENIRFSTVADADLQDSKDYFNIRYWGAFLCTKYASKNIRKSITYTSGIAANRPGVAWSLGASICGAMEAFMRNMSIELAPVRANAVSPGLVISPLWDGMDKTHKEAFFDEYKQKLPVKMIADGDDIAKTYIYLMEQDYSTGQVVVVDGGASLI